MKNTSLPTKSSKRNFIQGLGYATLAISAFGVGSRSTRKQISMQRSSQPQQYYLAGTVTGSPHKVEEKKRKYSIPSQRVYGYHNFDKIKNKSEISIVYTVVPSTMQKQENELIN